MTEKVAILPEIPSGEADAALSSSLAIASVGIATLQMLENLLPMAASEVEHESQKLSQHFMTVIDYLGKREELPQEIKNAISGVINGMQFQDRNTQIMENVTGILERYRTMLEDVSKNIESMRDGKYHSSKEIAVAVEGILSGIRLGDIRRRYVTALSKAQVPGHSDHVSDEQSGSDDNIELF